MLEILEQFDHLSVESFVLCFLVERYISDSFESVWETKSNDTYFLKELFSKKNYFFICAFDIAFEIVIVMFFC